MSNEPQRGDVATLIEKLRAAAGDQYVLTDKQTLDLYSIDFSEQRRETAAAVVQPGSTEEVAETAKLATSGGFPVCPRGGGMSYTLGHVPLHAASLIVDMTRMNRIVEINTDDLYITVEAGVTWKQIHDALAEEAYHVPFHGTISGIRSTVGGALGNNAVGLGKGTVVDDLLGVEVVLSDGRVIETGGMAAGNPAPLLPNYGPDLTGIFISDGGAFGIKTKATFRLTRKPGGTAYVSFGFQDRHSALAALCELGNLGIHSENFVFGRYAHEAFNKVLAPSMKEARAMLGRLIRSSSSRRRGLLDAMRIARPGGLKFLLGWEHSLHVVIDGFHQRVADHGAAMIKRIAKRHGGKTLPPTLPMGMRIDPFPAIDQIIIGTEGECSVPSNCMVPLSRAQETASALEAFSRENVAFMEKHGVVLDLQYLLVGNIFGIEPLISWRDTLSPLRSSILGPERREKASKIPADPAAREAATELRRRMVNLFRELETGHIQIGKFYPYRERLRSESNWRVLEDLKAVLDPPHLMNPGTLGLE
jgi:FAD/FMN-containing dehydrogenase